MINIICGLLILQSCGKDSLTRIYRADVMDGRSHSRDSLADGSGNRQPDTSVYVSAVIMPADYDWRRDSSYGAVACEIQLFKNGRLQFTAPAGAQTNISVSPDSHHLLGGHLYTERSGPDGTVICRDGVECLSWPERELLKGIIIKQGEIYTLGRRLDGSGFNFRLNGEVVLSRDGAVFGDFSNPAYGRTGALYENEGKICFCFRTSTTAFMVKDGVAESIRTGVRVGRIRDMRLIGPSCYYVADYTTSMLIFSPVRTITLPGPDTWLSASLFMHEGLPWFVADSKSKTVCNPVELADGAASVQFTGFDIFIYEGSSSIYALNYEGGTVRIWDADGELLYIRDSTFFFGPGSAFCADNEIYALINPREREEKPFIWHDGKETACGIDGYLTGIEVEISPPR